MTVYVPIYVRLTQIFTYAQLTILLNLGVTSLDFNVIHFSSIQCLLTLAHYEWILFQCQQFPVA